MSYDPVVLWLLPRRHPLDHLTVVAKNACVLVSHGSVTILGQLPLPAHCADSRLNHTSNLLWKTLICLSWIIDLRSKHLVWYPSRGLLRCTLGMNMSWCHLYVLFLPHSMPLASTRKEIVPMYGTLILVTPTHRTSLDFLPLAVTVTYICGLTGLYVFALFQSCCLRVWLPIRLNTGVEILIFGTVTVLGRSSITGNDLKKRLFRQSQRFERQPELQQDWVIRFIFYIDQSFKIRRGCCFI